MNKESIDLIIERNPKLKHSRHVLERMQPGAFCIHRSWGFGQVKSFDDTTFKLIIDFEGGKQNHPMDPAFCVGKLEILEEDNLLVKKNTDSAAIEEMIKKQPIDLVIEVLSHNPNGCASAVELEKFLSRLVGKTKFKKWWANTKKLLVKEPRIAVPVKKTDPYVLRDEPLTPEQEIFEAFYTNKNPKKKILLAEKLCQLSTSVEEIATDHFPRIMEELTEAIKEAKQLNQADRLHGVWVRNDLGRFLYEDEDVEALEPTSTSIIKATENLSALAEELPSSYFERFLDLLSRVYPEGWNGIVLNLLKNSTGKFTSECITFLIARECNDLISEHFQKWLNEQSLKGPVLYWILKNRKTRRFQRLLKDLVGPRLLNAVFYAIDYEALQATSNRRIMLADILSEDTDLIPDMLAEASQEIAKDLAHTLMHNQGFESLTKKSLLARFIKQFPSIQSLVAGDAEADSEAEQLIVSAESLEARKKEYETLINEKIPENKEAIAIARDHGDLKENSEYKMARQDQDMLLARKSLLESELSRARVSDLTNVTNEQIGIGSVVEVEQKSSSKTHTYAILGAWDSNPENDILSYKTPLGQKLLAKKEGDKVTTEIDGNEEIWTVKKISRWVDLKHEAKTPAKYT